VGEIVAAVRRAEATRWRGVSAINFFEGGGGVGEGFEPEVPSRAIGVGPVCLRQFFFFEELSVTDCCLPDRLWFFWG
jgi:hypothetical protein